MPKGKVFVAIATALAITILLGVSLAAWQWGGSKPPLASAPPDIAPNLGITYMPVTPGVAAYYGLGVNSGALVTEVAVNSAAERAGLRVGDVIFSLNGARVGEDTPLLGMMRNCTAGNKAVLEIWRGKSIEVIELVHTPR